MRLAINNGSGWCVAKNCDRIGDNLNYVYDTIWLYLFERSEFNLIDWDSPFVRSTSTQAVSRCFITDLPYNSVLNAQSYGIKLHPSIFLVT